jgi:hypothetical protein
MDACNLVLRQLNEVTFTSSTFGSATGFHAHVKDAINFALRDIAQREIEWPFALQTKTEVLVAEQNIYEFNSDFQQADWQTFHLELDNTLLVQPKNLGVVSYENWNYFTRGRDEANPVGTRIPEFVFKTNDDKWGVSPIPDRAYSISYDFWGFSTDLVDYDDVMVVPTRFRHVVADGALRYAYMFRDNTEQAQAAAASFERGLSQMRTLQGNRYIRVTDTRSNTGRGRQHGGGWF